MIGHPAFHSQAGSETRTLVNNIHHVSPLMAVPEIHLEKEAILETGSRRWNEVIDHLGAEYRMEGQGFV